MEAGGDARDRSISNELGRLRRWIAMGRGSKPLPAEDVAVQVISLLAGGLDHSAE